jgi:CHAT domain-containing protein
VFIVPDGTLSLVPFAALPVERDAFVLETAPPIHYLSAERDIVSMTHGRTSSGILALGGPTFDDAPVSPGPSTTSLAATETATETAALRNGRTACASLQSLQFQSLEGTLREVQEVSRLWPAPLGAARALVGREASERAFKQDASKYRVLHLATHGFFLDGSCLPESAPADTRGVGGLSATKTVENPLRLSGLALAGANHRALAGPDEDDGILTAEEVASLDLQGVEWAVLSACDTGVGEIRAGEGVFGLRRAFQVAGARTVVMSLWSVDDQATRAWMRALYEGRFQKNLSTVDAVHQASLRVLRDRRARGQSTHPFYWAAFVAAGDWR